MDILDFISQDNYICYNKVLAKKIGINETIIFMYFVSQYKRFFVNNLLTEDGYFYKTADDIYDNTGLSRKQQKLATNNLRELGLIDYTIKGIPAKLNFRIFKDRLLTIFENKSLLIGESSFDQRANQVLTKGQNCISPNSKTYINNITNKKLIIKNNIEYYDFVFDFIDQENTQIKYQLSKNKNYIETQFLEIDKLEKDGFGIDAIKLVLKFIKQDEFRSKQILSISKLRKKNKEGIPYMVLMIDRIKNYKPQKEIPTF